MSFKKNFLPCRRIIWLFLTHFLHIQATSPCEIRPANIFSNSVVCLFTLLMVSFDEQKLLILIFHCQLFFMVIDFMTHFKEVCLPQGYEDTLWFLFPSFIVFLFFNPSGIDFCARHEIGTRFSFLCGSSVNPVPLLGESHPSWHCSATLVTVRLSVLACVCFHTF